MCSHDQAIHKTGKNIQEEEEVMVIEVVTEEIEVVNKETEVVTEVIVVVTEVIEVVTEDVVLGEGALEAEVVEEILEVEEDIIQTLILQVHRLNLIQFGQKGRYLIWEPI